MKFKLLLPLLCCFILSACQNDKKQIVKVDDKYSVELPSFLSKAGNLNEEASLQYQNIFKEFYVIVIDEPKEVYNDYADETALKYGGTLRGYADLLINSITQAANVAKAPELKKGKTNGLNKYTTQLSGVVNNINVHWHITYLEGNHRYYQVLCWTLEEHKDEYRATMEQISNSFKEISKSL